MIGVLLLVLFALGVIAGWLARERWTYRRWWRR